MEPELLDDRSEVVVALGQCAELGWVGEHLGVGQLVFQRLVLIRDLTETVEHVEVSHGDLRLLAGQHSQPGARARRDQAEADVSPTTVTGRSSKPATSDTIGSRSRAGSTRTTGSSPIACTSAT